ncbi:MAG: cation-translocating P-type ATPase [Candidatus Poseidonia sp.]|nr:cation-translocating P-type ATPase [Poseidonia sp.]MBL6806309.1 cation-translocating P-type ATPase [Poseidonia sp.]MBL6885839.1 cation-translocating P-type ATPase [Poseidonia sp.]MBL6892524.1 cation-translocating P-type ATPase [Poseidonia sp.]
MGEDESKEVFLSLEDDEVVAAQPQAQKIKKPKPVEEDLSYLEAEIVDTSVIEEVSGSFSVTWPLLGMDCPDCAAKAMGALNHMKQVDSPYVSATSGEVKVNIVLDYGPMSEVSSVLRSLGHAPNVEHHELVGVRAAAVAHRNGVPVPKLERVIKRQPGILDAEISDDDRILVQLVSTANQELLQARKRALEQIIGAEPSFAVAKSNRLRPDQWRLIGGGIALPVLGLVILAEVLGFSGAVIGAIALPGVILGGLQMFKEALASLRNWQMGFQVLTSLAVIGACVLGMWEEALIVAILVAFTAHLEGDALIKAREAMQGGLDRLPRTARKITDQGVLSLTPSTPINAAVGFSLPMANGPTLPVHQPTKKGSEMVPIDLVRTGDKIEIRSGEIIPADGRIVEGKGALDKAPLTGESVPVDVGIGDVIEAGLVLARGPVVCEVIAVGDNTRLSGLIDAVHSFREAPPRLQSGIETFTAIWVPFVLFGAFAVWYFIFPDNWKIILLLWVVSCPCALLLATPVPHAAALSNAAHSGVIVRGGDALERMARVNHVLLDKTGTLTSGKPTVTEVVMAKKRQRKAALQLIMGLEARSSHPYALAVMEYCQSEGIEPATIDGLSDIDAGVEGLQGKTMVAFIRPDKAETLGITVEDALQNAFQEAQQQGNGASLLVKGGVAIALVSFKHDDVRDGSDALIREMDERNINVEILSGDHQEAVSQFARSVGLPESAAHGGLSPEEKVNWVKARSSSHVTMMVGDGFNDSAALAVSDVGVAVGTGESVNLEAADILIPGDDPRVLIDMIDLSRSAQRTLTQNLVFSVFITIILVYAVIQQWYDQLWVGVLIHEASVILVILNGARLAQNGQALTLLKETLRSMVEDTKVAFSSFRERYLPSKA